MIPKVSEENEYSPRAARRAKNFLQVFLEPFHKLGVVAGLLDKGYLKSIPQA